MFTTLVNFAFIYAARYQVYISGMARFHKLMPIPFGDIGPPAFLIVTLFRYVLSCRFLKCLHVVSTKYLLTWTYVV